MEYKIEILKTNELTENHWIQFTEGFNIVFERNRSVEEMKSIDKRNSFGFVYHAFAINEDGVIMGHHAKIPYDYVDGINFVVGVDSFVKKEFRKIDSLLFEMCFALNKHLKSEGIVGTLGVPNDNARPFTKAFREKYIGDLNYYLLPLHISRILGKKYLKPIDWIWMLLVYIWLCIYSLITFIFNSKEKVVKYRLNVDENFYNYRFSEKKYIKNIDKTTMYCFTNFEEEGGYTVSYLMDFREDGKRSAKSLLIAIKRILKQKDIDAIAFIGFLHLSQGILIKVPAKFVPKRFTLFYSIFDKKAKYEGIDNKENWDFSLLNYDVR